MIIAKEITEWTESPNTPNHTYLLSDKKAKVYAYWNVVDGTFRVLSDKGANFSASRRRFDIVARNITDISDAINTDGIFRNK